VDLQPGIATVEKRDQRQLRLRLDRDTDTHPAQLQGKTLLIRRLVKKVYLPQSWRTLAEEWQENGAAQVLPTRRTGGALLARLVWEDEKSPVKAGDRAEFCRIPPEVGKPSIFSLRCFSRRRPPGAEPAAAPGQEVWLKAEILCPTEVQPRCEWTADVGEFMHAGGRPAGKTLQGPALVRWRPTVTRERVGGQTNNATIRLRVSAGSKGQTVERSLAVRIEEPRGPYAKVQWTPTRLAGLKGSGPGPLFSDASLIAAGPLGSFYLVDAPKRRLLHWSQGPPRYVALESSPITGLDSFGSAAYLVQGKSLLCCKVGADKPEKIAGLPEIKRFVGLQLNAAGDVYVLDSGAPPSLHVLAKAGGESWRAAPLEPAIDSPWLTAFCVDPLSNDAYIFDSRDRMVRQWRALYASKYRLLGQPISVGKAVEQRGAPVALLPRLECDRSCDLPIRLVFKTGAVTGKWRWEGKPPRWEPTVARAPRQLGAIQFAARAAASLPDGDVLLGGQASIAGESVPVVAQLSARGKFRRMLPLPQMPPRFVAVAPGGLRYVLLVQPRWGRDHLRLVLLGPDGWMVEDLGALEAYDSISRVRPDRSSPTHVLLVGERRGRESAFRLDASDPTLGLELSSAGIPEQKIPEHRAVDVASSPEDIVVLDRNGLVLVFANRKPIRYLGGFDTELHRPKAIAVFSGAARRRAPGAGRRAYVCVLPSGRSATSIHLWETRTMAGGNTTAVKIGMFPDPERFPPAVQLSSPVTMESGFPDRQEMLYVLDRGGAQLRAFDVPEIASKISQRLVPEISATPLIDKLPFKDDGLDMAIGPGQVAHIADQKTEAIHTYARRP